MGVEIERKFLLRGEAWRPAVERTVHLRQGYLVDAGALAAGLARASVRVRLQDDGARLNIKAGHAGIAREEYDYPVPLEDGARMLETLCSGVLEKRRHFITVDGHVFEIDEFSGANAGLVVAELELPAVDADFPRPAWLGAEVSHLLRYFNVNLLARPYRDWTPAEQAGADAC